MSRAQQLRYAVLAVAVVGAVVAIAFSRLIGFIVFLCGMLLCLGAHARLEAARAQRPLGCLLPGSSPSGRAPTASGAMNASVRATVSRLALRLRRRRLGRDLAAFTREPSLRHGPVLVERMSRVLDLPGARGIVRARQ